MHHMMNLKKKKNGIDVKAIDFMSITSFRITVKTDMMQNKQYSEMKRAHITFSVAFHRPQQCIGLTILLRIRFFFVFRINETVLLFVARNSYCLLFDVIAHISFI